MSPKDATALLGNALLLNQWNWSTHLKAMHIFNKKRKRKKGGVSGPCFSPEKVLSALHFSIILLCLRVYLEALAYKCPGKYLSEGMYF